MKTEETNKLIAEFLQPTTKHDNFYFPQFKEPYIFQGNLEGYSEVFRTEDLKFHNDWNWLMEVVEKCFKIEANYGLHKNIEDALIFNSENRIQDVYNAVVQFIEVYNESFKQEAVYSIRDNSGE